MGQPIKDRGIRWVETYGDKSAHLKEECERQIGPGSYFRWEGHDSTTGTDYYVVIAPGYSKQHGYHFFAGLRKMPADQGASGKKFVTQAEAMSYADDKWRVPPPQIRPGKRYVAKDLVGKEIVLEGTHTAGLGPDPIVKTAMSLQGSGGIETEWSRRMGPRVLSDMYCFAYKASKSMGFLAGLYSRARFSGVDGMNTPTNQRGTNEFTGQDGPLPVSPIVATSESPTEDDFQRYVYGDGNTVENELVEFDRDEDKKTGKHAVKGVRYKDQYSQQEGPDYELSRWRHMKVTPTVSFFTDPDPAWLQSLAQAGIGVEPPKDSGKKSKRNSKDYRFSVPTEAWEGFKNDVTQNQNGHMFDLAGRQKKFIDLLEHRKASGQDISADLDKPYFETISMKGSQLLAYLDGVPDGLKIMHTRSTGHEAESKGGERHEAKYILRDPAALVDQWADPELGQWAMARDAATKAADPAKAQEAQQHVLRIVQEIASGARKPAPAYSRAVEAKDEAQKAALLAGFRELACRGHVPIAAKDVAESRTCAPKLGNTNVISPYVDNAMLPVNYDNTLMSPEEVASKGWKKAQMPYCPPYSVKARKQQMGAQSHYAARRYVPGKGYVYGPLPEGVQPVQKFNGTSIVHDKARMYLGKPDGGSHEIDAKEWMRYDPGAKGSFIPGSLYDVSMAPEHASTAGKDKNRVNKLGHARGGWLIQFEEHQLKDGPGGRLAPRMQGSRPFYPADPKRHPELYETEVDGQPYDLSQHAFADKGKVFFKDNWAAMEMMRKQLGIPHEEVGPFARITDQDLRIIDDQVADAVNYYEQMQKAPPEQQAQIDQEKFNYGRVCSQCGGGTPAPEVMQEMAKAMQDPEAALKPKQGVLFGIRYVMEGENGWVSDNDGEAMLFGAESQAQKALAMPDVRKLTENGFQVAVSQYPAPGKTTLMVPSLAKRMATDPTAELVPNSAQFADDIRNYNQIIASIPQDEAPKDKKPSDFAQEGETLEQPPMPEAPQTPEPLVPEQAPQQPPAEIAPEPAPAPAPPAAPVAPIAPKGPTAQEFIDRFTRQFMSPAGIRLRNDSINAGNPQLQAEVNSIINSLPPAPPRQAAMQRLVRLANWLDEKGGKGEADKVDGILKELLAQTSGPAPQQPADAEWPADPSENGRDQVEMSQEFHDIRKDDPYEPRPHGYEVRKPDPVKVTSTGTLPYREFIQWLKAHGSHSDGHDMQHADDPSKAFASYATTNTSSKLNYDANLGPNVYFNSGWDSSYHDANWMGQCILAAFGPTPEAAHALLGQAFAKLVPAEDPIKQRFEMRRLVRPGD